MKRRNQKFLKNDILKILRRYERPITAQEMTEWLEVAWDYDTEIETAPKLAHGLAERVCWWLAILENDGLVISRQGSDANAYILSKRGYEVTDFFYKKFIRIFPRTIKELLPLVATVLSIASISLSIYTYFK